MEHTVSLSAQTLFNFGPIPITNTLVVSWIIIGLLAVISFFATKNIKNIPSTLQNFAEMIVEGLFNFIEGLAGKNARLFFPIVTTFFLFIAFSNLIGLLPGFGTVGFEKHEQDHSTFVPFFRSINSDLNTTFALALISVIVTHFFAIKITGISAYLKKYFSFNPVFLFVGFLELISELTKVLSLSFRLFGNIFAGEAVLVTISSLFAFILPLPFIGLEIIVGLVQATVFMILTLVFMIILSQKSTH